jgi:hypothetical protein
MKRVKLEDMTIDQLVDRYAEICIAEDEAELMDEMDKFKHLFEQMRAVDAELRARGNDARLALLRLFDHPNLQVRLQAAKGTLGIAPVEARQVIQTISDWKLQPYALEAGMTLRNLDNGVFRPD